MTTLPYDKQRCAGTTAELCQYCRRREPGREYYQSYISPQWSVATGCPNYIAPAVAEYSNTTNWNGIMPRSHKIMTMPQAYKLASFYQEPTALTETWKYVLIGPCVLCEARVINCTHYGNKKNAVDSIVAMLEQMHKRYYDLCAYSAKLPRELIDSIRENVEEVTK